MNLEFKNKYQYNKIIKFKKKWEIKFWVHGANKYYLDQSVVRLVNKVDSK